MDEKFKALQVNKTWESVRTERNMKIIGNKWLYKVNYNPDGSISRYKATSVAKGYHQMAGAD